MVIFRWKGELHSLSKDRGHRTGGSVNKVGKGRNGTQPIACFLNNEAGLSAEVENSRDGENRRIER